MNQLDDFFKHKLGDENAPPEARFAFRAEHWADAEALIQADEARRRRRFWVVFLRWAGAATGLLLLIGGAMQGASFFSKNAPQAPAEIAAENSSNTQPSPFAAPIGQPDNPDFSMKTAAATAAKTASPPTGTPNRIAQADLFNPPAITPTAGPSPETNRSSKAAATSPQPAARALPEAIPTDFVPENLAPVLAPETAASARKTWHVAQVLPLKIPLVPKPPRSIAPQRPALASAARPAIRPIASRSLRLGAAANAAFAAHGKPSFSAGFLAKYSLNDRFFLGMGATLRRRTDALDSAAIHLSSSEQVRYGFGYERDFYHLTAQSTTWWAEFPLGLEWRPARASWSAEAGAMAGFFLGQRAERAHFSQNSLQLERTLVATERVWTNAPTLRQHYVGAFAGGQWHTPIRGLSLAARAHFAPGNLISNAENASPDAARFWLDAGLRFVW